MLSQFQNWILKEQVLSYRSHWSPLVLIFLDNTVCEGWMSFVFTCVHKGILVITQGCTKVSELYLWTGLID